MGTIGSSAESYAQDSIHFCVHIYATCYIEHRNGHLNCGKLHIRYMKGNRNIYLKSNILLL